MSNKKQFAVILAGSGVFDGSEIHETTFSLYAIMHHGAEYKLFAPDVDQHHVVNHIKGEDMPETSNVLVESARIARGNIQPLSEFQADQFDALLIPGGFGVPKNLADYALKGTQMQVHPEMEQAVKTMVAQKKPIAALCISPVIISKVLGDVELTIGQDEKTARDLEAMGSRHTTTNHGEVVVDKKYKVATTPCYMLESTVIDIFNGANNVVQAVMDMLD